MTAKIPIVTAPGILRYTKPMIMKKPKAAIIGENCCRSPKLTKVASLATIMPELFKAIKAKKAPIPATIPCFKLFGMALITHSRILNKLSSTKIQPDKNTAPKAVCQV